MTKSRRKTGKPINEDKLVHILVAAMLNGDDSAARRYNVSVRTIERYRARMHATPALSEAVAKKRQEIASTMTADLRDAVRMSITFLQRAAVEADPKDPDAIHAIAGALKVMNETDLTNKVIDARLSEAHRGRGEADHSLAPEGTEDPDDEQA